ncbi:hypothetical protein LGQ02_12175 [Bacillus shivajii]|uniref:hypothetical protein n=1 Tax=Bacillus shivajii TaxID=1983719 RepID=UPI001CFC14D7|nr:hypothetical protein [Bacillus shivajii]UCZ51621.1 hypothetical protein LGQ02_12175 [Bacillus shivajii]
MFEPYQTISLGPLTVSYMMLFLMISVTIGYFFINWYMKHLEIDHKEKVADVLMMSLIIGVLTYKFWPFVIEPKLLTAPQNLLYYSGGPYAILVAIILSIGYFAFQFFKNGWHTQVIDSVIIGSAVSGFTFFFFIREYGRQNPLTFGYSSGEMIHHPVNFYFAWLILLTIIGAMVLISKEKKLGRSMFILIGLVFSYLIISPLQM